MFSSSRFDFWVLHSQRHKPSSQQVHPTVRPYQQRTLHLAAHRRMRPVFDFDPVLRPSRLMRPIPPLAHQSLKPHAAGRPKQFRSDLAPLERVDEDAFGRRASSRSRLACASSAAACADRRRLPRGTGMELGAMIGVADDVGSILSRHGSCNPHRGWYGVVAARIPCRSWNAAAKYARR